MAGMTKELVMEDEQLSETRNPTLTGSARSPLTSRTELCHLLSIAAGLDAGPMIGLPLPWVRSSAGRLGQAALITSARAHDGGHRRHC